MNNTIFVSCNEEDQLILKVNGDWRYAGQRVAQLQAVGWQPWILNNIEGGWVSPTQIDLLLIWTIVLKLPWGS